jgi:hypothetical protein
MIIKERHGERSAKTNRWAMNTDVRFSDCSIELISAIRSCSVLLSRAEVYTNRAKEL